MSAFQSLFALCAYFLNSPEFPSLSAYSYEVHCIETPLFLASGSSLYVFRFFSAKHICNHKHLSPDQKKVRNRHNLEAHELQKNCITVFQAQSNVPLIGESGLRGVSRLSHTIFVLLFISC